MDPQQTDGNKISSPPLPARVNVFRSAPNPSNRLNLPPPGPDGQVYVSCMTIYVRHNTDLRDYLVVDASRGFDCVPQAVRAPLGLLDLWKRDAAVEHVLFFLNLLDSSPPFPLWQLRSEGYCVTRNKMAWEWEDYGRYCETTARWLANQMASEDWHRPPKPWPSSLYGDPD